MKPTKMSVFELFEKKRRYVVPLYQRQYVWTKDGQWEPLWENIREKAAAVLASERQTANAPANHFLGAIVLNQMRTFGKEIDAAQIIDGQQRLTTLQIFLAAFRDLVRTTEEEDLTRDLVALTTHSGTMKDEIERFKVWPTNADRDDFGRVLAAGSRMKLEEGFPQPTKGRKKLDRPVMAEAYLYFYNSIQSFVSELDEESGCTTNGSDNLHALFNTLRKHLELVVIELEEADDPQVIFETLNFGGVPLFPSDLVRNFIFLRAANQKVDTDALYSKLWSEFDTAPAESVDGDSNLFWKRMEKQGRNKRTRLDLFLHHYLTYRKEGEVNIGHLFRDFRDWWGQRSVEGELAELRRHGDIFRGFFVPDVTTRLGQFAARLRTMDTSTVYPLLLLLAVEGKEQLAAADLNAILTDLESYIVRRLVCGLPLKHYNRFFLDLLQALRKAGSIDPATFRGHLLTAQGDSTRWPQDGEFEKHWIYYEAYTRLGPAVASMILEALEQQLRTAKSEKILIQGPLTVEHVLPQNWQAHWPTNGMPDVETFPGEDEAGVRDRMLHTIGNLTLLTQELNASVKNAPFCTKRPEIAKQSSLTLNAYFQEFQNCDAWSETTILERSQRLFKTALKVWPHPGAQLL